ncbi:MAG: ABC transporter ATP-binding protein [Acidimicrobiales bacterium]
MRISHHDDLGVASGATVECEGLVRLYSSSETEVVALQGLDLRIDAGEMVSIVGASGSGKSTLLNILAGLDRPTAGRVTVDGHDLLAMSESDRLDYRRRVVGFVWQQTARNLLPYLSARDNVMLPLTVAGAGRSERDQRVAEVMTLVGIEHRSDHRPDQLSGGEQQRVAVAVALANRPRLLLADEPTGELDLETAADVVEVLRTSCRELGVTTVIVTHDETVARAGNRSITIRDGRVSSERRVNEWTRTFEDERIVVDRAGRLQLPERDLEQAGLGRLVRVQPSDECITIERDEP